ncbi:MAG: hypothetical protein ABS87_11690 [Sphingomonas sp. SCN 67-18]|nr:MAG: hypothetical protein ABS87_11690 [Sphingomonas sp. SCN 67-18]
MYALGKADQAIIRSAVCCLTDRQVKSYLSREGISQTVKFTGEPAQRAVKSALTSSFFPLAAETWAQTIVLSML